MKRWQNWLNTSTADFWKQNQDENEGAINIMLKINSERRKIWEQSAFLDMKNHRSATLPLDPLVIGFYL